jgi:nicotinate-nucleotide adenylyltransferase
MSTRVALYGGSFDPPHIGHVAFVRALATAGEFDEVWVIPSVRHPFGKEMEPLKHRMAMCRIAFAWISETISIRNEEERAGGSGYTIDLVRYLLKAYPGHRFTLALGSDNYSQRHKWKRFDEIERLIDVRYFGRRGSEAENEELGLDTPFPRVSSTDLRRRLCEGELPKDLLPDEVAGYIREHGLYVSS